MGETRTKLSPEEKAAANVERAWNMLCDILAGSHYAMTPVRAMTYEMKTRALDMLAAKKLVIEHFTAGWTGYERPLSEFVDLSEGCMIMAQIGALAYLRRRGRAMTDWVEISRAAVG